MKLLVCFSLMFFAQVLEANTLIGTITKIRGKASVLEIGERDAKSAKEGQKIYKEASILTADKSFVRIQLLDNSQINLGANSKIILDQTTFQNIGVVSLLRGMVRTVVEKDNDEKNKSEKGKKDKLYIKTRTAALGIRGTDFLTNYNPENNITNLVTFRGKVAIVKSSTKDFAEALKSKDTMMVESGKFSTVTDSLNQATGPVKISSVQYTGLKLNKEMDSEIIISKVDFQNELLKTVKEFSELAKLEKSDAGIANADFDAKNKTLRPTSGGVVDLASGIYVSPSETKENLNTDLNIYEFKSDKGHITENGLYTPPEGLKLDPKLGFIADSQVTKRASVDEILKLNNDLGFQGVKPIERKIIPKPSKDDLKNSGDDAYDKYFIKE